MKVSPEVEIACNLALREAERRHHDVMTVEHLLYALLHDEVTAKVIRKSGGSVDKLKVRLDRILRDELPAVPEGQGISPTPSRGFQRVLQRAAFHVQSSGKERLEGHNVLIAIFAEPESPAAEAMKAEGITRYDVVNYVSHGVAKDGSEDEALELSEGTEKSDDDDDAPDEPRGDPLKQFAVNLNERAKNGDVEPLVGRDKEMRLSLIHI